MTRERGVRPLDLLPPAEPLASQLRFLLEADRLKSVVRGNRIADGTRRENTAEHSWHIALFALVLAPHAAERVDVLRVVSMLLVHDLVEIDCGDTPLFDEVGAATQAAREAAAARRLLGYCRRSRRPRCSRCGRSSKPRRRRMRGSPSRSTACSPLLNHAVGGGTWTDYDVDEARERALTCRIAEGSPALWSVAEAVIKDALCRGWLKPAPGT